MDNKTAQLSAITEAVQNLTESPLYAYRHQNNYHPVIGEGNSNASLMIIGEAPGASEAKTGRPFVGASGRFLDTLFESIGVRREDVYITNIVKDRPPENRDPSAEEIRLYAPFLVQQINIIEPKVIVTLGRFSMDFILELFQVPEHGQKISVLHGKPLAAHAAYGNLTIVPLFHPAVALYRTDLKATLQQDFQSLKPLL